MIGFRFNKVNKQDIKLMLLFRLLCGNEIFLVVDLHVNNQKHGYFVYIWLELLEELCSVSQVESFYYFKHRSV